MELAYTIAKSQYNFSKKHELMFATIFPPEDEGKTFACFFLTYRKSKHSIPTTKRRGDHNKAFLHGTKRMIQISIKTAAAKLRLQEAVNINQVM